MGRWVTTLYCVLSILEHRMEWNGIHNSKHSEQGGAGSVHRLKAILTINCSMSLSSPTFGRSGIICATTLKPESLARWNDSHAAFTVWPLREKMHYLLDTWTIKLTIGRKRRRKRRTIYENKSHLTGNESHLHTALGRPGGKPQLQRQCSEISYEPAQKPGSNKACVPDDRA